MTRTLYLPDGSMEVIFGNPEEELQKLIHERLGRDAEILFREIIAEHDAEADIHDPHGEDYERIADGYLSLIRNTVEELDASLTMFEAKRLNKDKLSKQLQAIRDNLNNNT